MMHRASGLDVCDMRSHTKIIAITILLTVALIDGGLKYTALRVLPTENNENLSPILAFTLHKNPGITFDIAVPFLILMPLTLCMLFGIAYHAWRFRHQQPRITLGLIAILIGATDNFIDRVVNGFTTDYIMFFNISVLNLADLLIMFGAIIIFMYYTTNPVQRRA